MKGEINMQKESREKKARKTFRVSPAANKLLCRRARDEQSTEAEIMVKALTLYLTKDVMDESLLIAKMNELDRKLQFLDKKIELGQKYFLEYLRYFFLNFTDPPKDKDERAVFIKDGMRRFNTMLKKFKLNLTKTPAFLETILGDMLEEEFPNDAR
jgi:uncharacterized protein (DUF1778 family)